MNSTETSRFDAGQGTAHALLPASNPLQRTERVPGEAPAAPPAVRRSGYGLPCAKCRTYYAADLSACPVCKSTERVSPIIPDIPNTVAPAEDLPDPEALEAERERFLREFRAQIYAGEMQIHAEASFRCSKVENHEGAFEPAAICQSCYDHLQERVDMSEAALLMDTNEAARIVYEAVWADPSDPSRTYLNAAQALLGELRKRAGVSTILGPLRPLAH
jgi:hypothetical protein